MDIDNIKTILKVAEYSSINKASLAVYKTQSQVSRIVRDFEGLINISVFERSNKGVKITKEGEHILEYCKKIVSLYDEMILSNTNLQNKDYYGVLNIYNSINIYSTVSEILSSFANSYPHISINFSTLSNHKIVSTISDYQNSIGILTQIYSTDYMDGFYTIPDDLLYTELLNVPIVALCNAESPYVQKFKSLSVKSLSTLALIQYNPYKEEMSFTSTILELLGISSPNFQYTVDDLRILQQLLDKNSGIYIGILPSPKLLSENISAIPIRHKISVGFGTLIKRENENELVTLFNNYLVDWYKKIY